MFPRSFFYVEASNSRKEPVDITLEEANINLTDTEEIDYNDENFSDPLIDGEDDLYEGKQSLSELLK